MGNTASTSTTAAGRECLLSAVGGDAALVSFQNKLLYEVTAVHEYNLNFPVTPAAITFPETGEQVAAIVKCAAEYDYKVQARSGGHSFGNYGEQASKLEVMMVAVAEMAWQDSVARTARSSLT